MPLIVKRSPAEKEHVDGPLPLKAKGHLGSLLENTCETIIRVEKDKNNRSRSIVSPKEMRGEEFDSFVIEMDFQGIPYISILEEHEQGKLKI